MLSASEAVSPDSLRHGYAVPPPSAGRLLVVFRFCRNCLGFWCLESILLRRTPSVTCGDSSLKREPFGMAKSSEFNLTKSCPHLWGKWTRSGRKGNSKKLAGWDKPEILLSGYKLISYSLIFPLSLTSFDSSPAGGGAFWSG